jgi:4-alpha-glucanotransferase
MRVAQFGFDGNSANIHLPHNWVPRSIAYTGTHDNDTTVGWFAGLDATARAEVRDYLAAPEGQEAVELTRAVLGSVATLAVVPMQDLLGLGRAARMNTPGTTVGNWTWSFAWADVPTGLSRACRRVNELYGRASRRGG